MKELGVILIFCAISFALCACNFPSYPNGTSLEQKQRILSSWLANSSYGELECLLYKSQIPRSIQIRKDRSSLSLSEDDAQNAEVVILSTPILKYISDHYIKVTNYTSSKLGSQRSSNNVPPGCALVLFFWSLLIKDLCESDGPSIRPAPEQDGGPFIAGDDSSAPPPQPTVPPGLNTPGFQQHPSDEQIAMSARLSSPQPWMYEVVNPGGLNDNCYLCSLAGILGTNVGDLINRLNTMEIDNGSTISHITDLYAEYNFHQVGGQRFGDSLSLYLFLEANVPLGPVGSARSFILMYEGEQGQPGHVVVLYVYNTYVHGFGYYVADFQVQPNDSRRIQPNWLPTTPSYLFSTDRLPTDIFHTSQQVPLTPAQPDEPQDDSDSHDQMDICHDELRASGPAKCPATKYYWFDFTYVAQDVPSRLPKFKALWMLDSSLQVRPFYSSQNPKLRNQQVSEVALFNGSSWGYISIASTPAIACGKKIIGYYTSWGESYFTAFHAQRLTHVIFAFMEMRGDGSVTDASLGQAGEQRLKSLLDVGSYFPHLRIMFAIGGWENSQYFSGMAANPSSRGVFISSITGLINKWGFHGVDIDWEHPVTGGANEGIPQDKQNYVTLMMELRQALNNLGPDYEISFAGSAGKWTLEPGYDLPNLLKYADWVNVMTYDYYGAWASEWGAFTGSPAPLFYSTPEKWSGMLNADWTLKYYTCRIGDPNKVVMGVPFYGRYWNNVGDPVDPSKPMWRVSVGVDGGSETWNDIKTKYLTDGSYSQTFDSGSMTPFLYSQGKRVFMGYENPESVQAKVNYAMDKNLGGLMVWAVDFDDQELSMLTTVSKARLCTGSYIVNYKCSPILDQRWWTWAEDTARAGMCGRSAPLYNGFYPVCDPEDAGYSCCGQFGFCGSGPEFCDCPTCKDYGQNPELILQNPVKPTGPALWYTMDTPEGQRGRCGRDIPKINDTYPICNPDDENAHCCSNGFYCGSGADFCTCDGCVDFALNPTYRFKEKTWWDWSDGPDKSGLCGSTAPKLPNGGVAECDPDSEWYCCSQWGTCGGTPEHCDCPNCVNYRGA